MDKLNQTFISEFLLLSFSGYPKTEIIYFALVLVIYLVILIGNGALITACIFDSHLHTPMYFFLANLSFLDICYTTSSVSSTLVSLISKKRNISFSGYTVQMFLGFAMGSTECLLLGMMAFDCYVAICNALRYPMIMSKEVYVVMASVSWLCGGTNSVVQTSLAMRLPFCGNNIINHFICEVLAVLKLVCAYVSLNIITMMISNMVFLILLLLVIFFSYLFILLTILRMNTATGRLKAFSTCSAHLTVVIIFYGTIFSMYAKPKSHDPTGEEKFQTADKIISLFYGIVTPMLNPVICSLRNKDVKAAIKYILKQKPIK
ncbi:LOW QUALITY PROTEIN: olfactory receptor 13C3-like [Perognathus longimembris pacificus]|uniref:LOW QUALITY PROTEIN: olfactory receptor 13C3-like n=1 Tax=Perognathus longimembris pacificus TaxID=214514 RepID=UPI00201967D3|nr:LOW QUALITY PROTEIN: olfactory receptor 13C3-like [Perognathus longimembris pacificus]